MKTMKTIIWFLINWFLDPTTWNKQNVKDWLTWVAKVTKLKEFDTKKFSATDGYKLCQMTMRDLCRVTEKPNAEVILNRLSLLKRSNKIWSKTGVPKLT